MLCLWVYLMCFSVVTTTVNTLLQCILGWMIQRTIWLIIKKEEKKERKKMHVDIELKVKAHRILYPDRRLGLDLDFRKPWNRWIRMNVIIDCMFFNHNPKITDLHLPDRHLTTVWKVKSWGYYTGIPGHIALSLNTARRLPRPFFLFCA